MTLALDSPQWDSLLDAYGSAKHVPGWLKRLESQEPEALDELYARICHQRSVYSSSIAALPHLVRIARTVDADKFRAEILILCGAICESHEFERELTLSGEIAAIDDAIAEALVSVEDLLRKVDEPHTANYLLQSAAAFSGFVEVARVIEGFVDEEFCLECANCGSELYIWPTEDGLVTAAEDPVTNPNAAKIAVASGPRPDSDLTIEYAWLNERIARSPALVGVGKRLPSLFGTVTCPNCQSSFSLMDGLIEEAT